jgi:hypothetical protein
MNCVTRVFHAAAPVAQAAHSSARRGGKLDCRALCRGLRQLRTEVRGIRGHSLEALVGPSAVIEADVDRPPPIGFSDLTVGMQLHLFMLHASPEPLDQDIQVPQAPGARKRPLEVPRIDPVHRPQILTRRAEPRVD